jgi:hypothetical protein
MNKRCLCFALCCSLVFLCACGGGAKGGMSGLGGGQLATNHFSVTAVAAATAGTTFNVTVTATPTGVLGPGSIRALTFEAPSATPSYFLLQRTCDP